LSLAFIVVETVTLDFCNFTIPFRGTFTTAFFSFWPFHAHLGWDFPCFYARWVEAGGSSNSDPPTQSLPPIIRLAKIFIPPLKGERWIGNPKHRILSVHTVVRRVVV
jgi:hypothetical protein